MAKPETRSQVLHWVGSADLVEPRSAIGTSSVSTGVADRGPTDGGRAAAWVAEIGASSHTESCSTLDIDRRMCVRGVIARDRGRSVRALRRACRGPPNHDAASCASGYHDSESEAIRHRLPHRTDVGEVRQSRPRSSKPERQQFAFAARSEGDQHTGSRRRHGQNQCLRTGKPAVRHRDGASPRGPRSSA